MATPERYTLDEARVALAQQECAAHDHDWEIIQAVCGDSRRVEEPAGSCE